MLVRYACGDPGCPYGLHPRCLQCDRLSCPHAAAFLHAHAATLAAAIAALPVAPAWPALAVMTVLPCERRTARLEWRDHVWARRAPIVAVELGVLGQPPGWRLYLGVN